MKVVNSNQGKGKPSGIRRLYRHNFSANGRSKPRSPLSMHLGMPRMAAVTTWQGAVSWAGSIQGRRLSLGIDTATQPKGLFITSSKSRAVFLMMPPMKLATPNGHSMPKTNNLDVFEQRYDANFYETMAKIMALRQKYLQDRFIFVEGEDMVPILKGLGAKDADFELLKSITDQTGADPTLEYPFGG
ncbi:unnamed protein product [Aspergillus oryzae RIB40]|uniref:DNA, SC012 n=1 Tax=Aspergillus oryzae (strain ATCC 42149 / RIB 40) TaxID=510516 RepID=Q2UDD0_ASPOR|nr:unnamed protein product [Aspergillus oryzae RIB40]BAE60435.1 unnamed protein product [Aspergillus oryzae RIB40]